MVRARPRPSHAERGSTLTEALIAGVLVTAVALSFGTAEPSHARAVRAAFEESLALRAAQSALEEARRTPRAWTTGRAAVAVDPALAEQLRDACAERLVTAVEPGIVEVTVTVTWRPTGSTGSAPDASTARSLTTRIATGGRR